MNIGQKKKKLIGEELALTADTSRQVSMSGNVGTGFLGSNLKASDIEYFKREAKKEALQGLSGEMRTSIFGGGPGYGREAKRDALGGLVEPKAGNLLVRYPKITGATTADIQNAMTERSGIQLSAAFNPYASGIKDFFKFQAPMLGIDSNFRFDGKYWYVFGDPRPLNKTICAALVWKLKALILASTNAADILKLKFHIIQAKMCTALNNANKNAISSITALGQLYSDDSVVIQRRAGRAIASAYSIIKDRPGREIATFIDYNNIKNQRLTQSGVETQINNNMVLIKALSAQKDARKKVALEKRVKKTGYDEGTLKTLATQFNKQKKFNVWNGYLGAVGNGQGWEEINTSGNAGTEKQLFAGAKTTGIPVYAMPKNAENYATFRQKINDFLASTNEQFVPT